MLHSLHPVWVPPHPHLNLPTAQAEVAVAARSPFIPSVACRLPILPAAKCSSLHLTTWAVQELQKPLVLPHCAPEGEKTTGACGPHAGPYPEDQHLDSPGLGHGRGVADVA